MSLMGGADAWNFKPHQQGIMFRKTCHTEKKGVEVSSHIWMQIVVMIIIVETSDIADCRDFDSNPCKDSISVAVPAQSLRNVSTHGVWCTNMAGQTQNSDNLCPGASKQTRNKPITPKKNTHMEPKKWIPGKGGFLLEPHPFPHFQLPALSFQGEIDSP